ncbi:4-hydroxy-tetrahydrodipicolinate reductase [Luteimonas sp. A277]
MNHPVRLLIHGASGRMGQALLRLCREQDGCQVVAAVSTRVQQRVVDGVPWFTAAELGNVPEFDVAVDFSLPAAFDAILELCRKRGRPLVSGTTGLSAAQRSALEEAAAGIPVLWASNFSLGVAVLHELVERAAKLLPGWDCDIIEVHHVHKQDAPSGTALTLGAAAGEGGAQARYASIRAGDVVGEHSVLLTAAGERIELVHRATNRDIFARGALHAARRIAEKPPGIHQLRELL